MEVDGDADEAGAFPSDSEDELYEDALEDALSFVENAFDDDNEPACTEQHDHGEQSTSSPHVYKGHSTPPGQRSAFSRLGKSPRRGRHMSEEDWISAGAEEGSIEEDYMNYSLWHHDMNIPWSKIVSDHVEQHRSHLSDPFLFRRQQHASSSSLEEEEAPFVEHGTSGARGSLQAGGPAADTGGSAASAGAAAPEEKRSITTKGKGKHLTAGSVPMVGNGTFITST